MRCNQHVIGAANVLPPPSVRRPGVPPVTEGGARRIRGWDKGLGEGACGTGAEEAIVGKEVVATGKHGLGDVGVDDRDFF